MGLKETGWDGVNWIRLAQDRDHYRAFLNTEMNFQVPQNVSNFLTSSATVSFARKTLLRGVTKQIPK
jgi:hypothetical protein